MIRTKHLVVTGAFLMMVVSVGGLGTLAAQGVSAMQGQSATIVLGMPADRYTAVVAETKTEEVTSFAERIQDSYIPPASAQDEERRQEEVPTTEEETPVSLPEMPTSQPLPIATTEEEVEAEHSTSTSVASSSSTTTLDVPEEENAQAF